MAAKKIEDYLPRDLRSPAVEVVIESVLGRGQQHNAVRHAGNLEFLCESLCVFVPD